VTVTQPVHEYGERWAAVSPRCRCGKMLASITTSKHATFVVKRTCRYCRERWQITVKPIGAWIGKGTFAWDLTLAPIGSKEVAK
jgi:hypothetical protein